MSKTTTTTATAKKTTAKKTTAKKTTAKKTTVVDEAAVLKTLSAAERAADAAALRAEAEEDAAVAARAPRRPERALGITVVNPAAPTPKAVTAARPATAPAAKQAPRMTVSSVACQMIEAGETNEAVMAALVERFGLKPETQSHYPGWYRARLVRSKAITKKFADEHRHDLTWCPGKKSASASAPL